MLCSVFSHRGYFTIKCEGHGILIIYHFISCEVSSLFPPFHACVHVKVCRHTDTEERPFSYVTSNAPIIYVFFPGHLHFYLCHFCSELPGTLSAASEHPHSFLYFRVSSFFPHIPSAHPGLCLFYLTMLSTHCIVSYLLHTRK